MAETRSRSYLWRMCRWRKAVSQIFRLHKVQFWKRNFKENLIGFFGRSRSVCRLWQEKETINGNSTAFTPKDSPPWLAVLQQSAVFLWLPADIRQAKTERLDLKKQQAKGLWESFNFCQAFCVWHVHRGPSFLKFKLPVGGNFKEEPPESTGSFIKERQVHRQAGSRQRRRNTFILRQ